MHETHERNATMRNVMIMLALALFAGCATKEMKSTPFYEGTDVT